MISVIQSKTNYPLSLPLIATVGNAILDYVITSRPSTTEPNILVTSNRPHKPYKQSASAVLKIFRLAGVRTSGGIKGFRTFRHHFVTSLLSHNVECDVVSSLVGHQSPTSLKPYADADLKHLKECAIDVSVYDINPNVFKL